MINWKKARENAGQTCSFGRRLIGGFVIVGRGWDGCLEIYGGDEKYLVELALFKRCTKKSCGYGFTVSAEDHWIFDAVESVLQKVSDGETPSFCGLYGMINAYMGNTTKSYSFGKATRGVLL